MTIDESDGGTIIGLGPELKYIDLATKYFSEAQEEALAYLTKHT